MSVTIFDGLISKFYFIKDYESELYLVKILLLSLLKYSGYNIYIHNGIRFNLIFLFKHFIKVAKESKLLIEVIYKNGELLNVSIIDNKDKKNLKMIHFKDSLNLLLGSLSKLAKSFGIEEGKGCFPFDLAKPSNFSYKGVTLDYKYYAFNGKILISREAQFRLIKVNWLFREELKIYNIQDCVVLYNILTKFNLLIRDKYNFNMHNNPTLSSLAFSIYIYKYIPAKLKFDVKIGKQIQFKSLINSLDQAYDIFVRNSYFRVHVELYIPCFNNQLSLYKSGGGTS